MIEDSLLKVILYLHFLDVYLREMKSKNKCFILTHIYGIWKDSTDGTICRTAMQSMGSLRVGLD